MDVVSGTLLLVAFAAQLVAVAVTLRVGGR